MHAPRDSQVAFRQRAPSFVSEAIERSTGRVHLILLENIRKMCLKESRTLTFATYSFEHWCMLRDSCLSEHLWGSAREQGSAPSPIASIVSASNRLVHFFPDALFLCSVLSNCFRGPEKNCLTRISKRRTVRQISPTFELCCETARPRIGYPDRGSPAS